MAGERPNHSINLTAQSYALGTLHASGIPAAGYFQRYGIAACSAAAGELGLQNFQGASPANPKKASKDRSSTSPERSLGSFESAGNSTSKFDYWVPVNVKAPRALFKHPRGIASAPHIPTSCSVLSSNPVYSLVNLGVPNSITIGSSRSLRSLGTG